MKYIHYLILALTVFIISSLSYAQIEVRTLHNQRTNPSGIEVLTPNGQRTNLLNVEVFLDKDPSGESVPNYQLNEKIQIGVRPSASSYLYLFHLNSQGKAVQVFPNRYDGNNFLKGGETVYIPNNHRYSLSISGPEGLDHVVAIVSKHRLEGHKITFADYFEGYKPKHPPASFWASDVTRFWLGHHRSATVNTPTLSNTESSSPSINTSQSPPSSIKTEAPEPSTTFTSREFSEDTSKQTNTSPSTDNQIITIAPSETDILDQTTNSPSTDNQSTSTSQTAVSKSNSQPSDNKDHQVYAVQSSYSKWQTANVQNYSFIFKQECYCLEEYLKAMYVVVREGKVSSVTYHEDNQAVPENVFASVLTLGELLEGTFEVEKNSSAKVEGEYDRDFGFPKKLFIDNDINVDGVNDEISYEVSFFRVE